MEYASERNLHFVAISHWRFNNAIEYVSVFFFFFVNLCSYSARRGPGISGGIDRRPHRHHIAAVIGLLYYPVSQSTTEAAEFTDSVEKSIWLRYKYEGKDIFNKK